MTYAYKSSAVLRCREVEKLTGLSRSTIYDMVKKGLFPPPVRLGSRAVGWRLSEVEDWIASRARAR